MIKSLPKPYPFHKQEEAGRIIYAFETDHHVHYRAYFSDYSYMFGSSVFSCRFLSFDLVLVGEIAPPKNTPTDYRIRDTIIACFKEIFQIFDNVVIAVYDSADKKERMRQRKFHAWFISAGIEYIEKIDFELEGEDYTLVSSVFLHTDLFEKEAVLELYQQVLEGGNMPLE
nr:DUF6169 family protein [uncultured Arsenicibacter sp.]